MKSANEFNNFSNRKKISNKNLSIILPGKFIISSLLLLLIVTPVSALTWTTETVDNTGDIGDWISLAIDSSNNPHISYYDSINKDLKYAHYDGTVWNTERVENAGTVGILAGQDTSIALDCSNNPHISYGYYGSASYALMYTSFNGTSWNTEKVDYTGYVGGFTSLALDSSNNPHISYYDHRDRDLRYAYYKDQKWYKEISDASGQVGIYNSLGLDSSNNPHIIYVCFDNYENNDYLKYAYHNGTAWNTKKVNNTTANFEYYTSLALDSSNNPHISYFDGINNDLKYSYYNGTAWNTEIIDSVGNIGRYTSLALDSSNNPHISYFDETNSILKYAYYDGAVWIIEDVGNTGSGYYTSLALDSSDKPHICYYNSNGDLKYASGTADTPTATPTVTPTQTESPTINSSSNAPDIEWQQCLGGVGHDRGHGIIQTPDNGYAIAGFNSSGKYGNQDAWLVKLDSAGDVEWQECFGGTGSEYAYDLIQTTNQGYAICGRTTSQDNDVSGYTGFPWDWWVLKVNSIGNFEWQKCLGGNSNSLGVGGGDESANSIIQTSDGGYAIAGYTASNDDLFCDNHGYYDFFVVKLNSTGGLEWQKCFGGNTNGLSYISKDLANSVIETSDGGLIVIGSVLSDNDDISGNHGDADIWLIKLDSSGNLNWQKCYGGSLGDFGTDVIQTSNGGYAIAGYTASNDGDVTKNNGKSDIWIIKLDSIGHIDWQYSYGGSSYEKTNSIIETSDGGYAISGQTESNDGDVSGNHGLKDIWTIKINATGGLEWQKCLGGTSDDGVNDGDFGCSYGCNNIIHTSDGGYAITGYTESNDNDVSGNHGLTDMWVVKLSGDGTSSTPTPTPTPDPADIQAPTLISPGAQIPPEAIQTISDTTPEFSWTEVDGAEKYLLQIFEKQNDDSYAKVFDNTEESIEITQSPYTLPDVYTLQEGSSYYWLMKAYSTEGGWSEESGKRYFDIDIPQQNVEHTCGKYTITWDGSPESVVPGHFYKYKYSIFYDGDDDPENVSVMIELDENLKYKYNTISLVDENGNEISSYPSSNYVVSYDEYAPAVQDVIQKSRNQFHYNEANHVLVGSFDKLLFKNDKGTDHVEGEIEVWVENDASGTITNSIQIKDEDQLVNTFYGGIGFNPADSESFSGRLRQAFLFDATLRYSYGISHLILIDDIIDDGLLDVTKAEAELHSADNYLGTDEGNGEYNIAFSHSGGTQTLFQKIQLDEVFTDYAVFISPAMIYESLNGYMGDPTFAEYFDELINSESIKKAIVVWSDSDVLNNPITQNDAYGISNNPAIISINEQYTGFNSPITVHGDLVERTIKRYTEGENPFIGELKKQVLPRDQQLEIASDVVLCKKVDEDTSSFNIPDTQVEDKKITIDTTEGGVEKTGNNAIKVTKPDGTILQFETEGVKESGNTLSGTIKYVDITLPSLEGEIDSKAGTAKVDVHTTMGDYQEGASIKMELSTGASENERNAFSLACTKENEDLLDVAYSVKFTKSGFTDESSIMTTLLKFRVSNEWVDTWGIDKVRIIRWKDDGTSETIIPLLVENSGGYSTFAVTTGGFSSYGIVAVSPSSSTTTSTISSTTTTHYSSSGSGSYSSKTDAGSADGIKYGESATISFNGDETAITSLCIVANSDSPSALFTTEKKGTLPSTVNPADYPVYQYVEITPYKIESDSISEAKISFSIPNSWLTTNGYSTDNILMLHYNEESGEWETLSTTFVGEDGSLMKFEATTDSFSYYAIAAIETSAATKSITTDSSDTTLEQKSAPTEIAYEKSGENKDAAILPIDNKFPLNPVILMITGIIIASIGGSYYFKKRRQEKYPEWWFKE